MNIYCNLNIMLNRKGIEMNITDKAVAELQPILDENPDKLLRVLFQGFGWAGPKLGLALEEPDEKDLLEINGLSLMMDETVRGFSEGQLLDFIDNKHGHGFIIQPEQGGCWLLAYTLKNERDSPALFVCSRLDIRSVFKYNCSGLLSVITTHVERNYLETDD